MVDDIIDATRWAINYGYADAGRICIMGHSYGGYAAIWSTIKEPELYRCAIGSMGVYDLPYVFEEKNITGSTQLIKYFQDSLGTEVDKLRKNSPVFNVDKIKVPILLSHGTKDDISPFEQATRFRKALDKEHVGYEWIELKGTGHFYSKKEHRKEFYSKVLAFLDKHTREKTN